jgi:hypothetical protein
MRWPVLFAALLAVAVGAPAWAQFSPGDLAKAHHELEGLRNCEKCHEPGSGLANQRCLTCHPEIEKRIESKHGFHGRAPTRDQKCETCHHEHRGVGFDLLGLDERVFDHGRTGFTLEAKHQQVKCAS